MPSVIVASGRGRWQFQLDPAGAWSQPLDGAALAEAVREGFAVRDGIRWTEVSGAEISNIDGAVWHFSRGRSPRL
jgi:hypothetical protein